MTEFETDMTSIPLERRPTGKPTKRREVVDHDNLLLYTAEVRRNIITLNGQTTLLEQLHGQLLVAVDDEAEKKIMLVSRQSSNLAVDIKAKIYRLFTHDAKDWQNIKSLMLRDLHNAVRDLYGMEKQVSETIRDRRARELALVKGIRPSEAKTMLEIEDEGQDEVFERAFLEHEPKSLLDSTHVRASHNLQQLTQRSKEIKELEADILTLHQLFLDLSLLVNEQGHMIDSIEHHVNKSVEHSAAGVRELVMAEKHSKQGRKACCIAIVILLCLFALIAMPILIARYA